ncbi:beta-defensin 135 [Mastomys coucha]|uniref:beta-defensin 135 n=1 Tax=Mastomys coucha TaxID=35658 RepID=UPI00126172F2|nr:beta-defensin 135 [Mastomys coucha]
MQSLQLTLVLFVLFSYVPPVRSGVNMYIKRIYDTCWNLKGMCKNHCPKDEIFHTLCGVELLCCIKAKEMPVLFVK